SLSLFRLATAAIPRISSHCTLYEILAAFFGKMSSGIRTLGYAVEAPRARRARPQAAERIRPSTLSPAGAPSNGVRLCPPGRRTEAGRRRRRIISPPPSALQKKSGPGDLAAGARRTARLGPNR